MKRQAGVETRGGAWYPLFDGAGGEVEWRLKYGSLTREEAERLREFHAEMEGTRGRFTFADPLANLLKWSEDLSQPEWQGGGAQGGQEDPGGGNAAFLIGAGVEIRQVVPAPGEYKYCFSVQAAGAEGTRIRLRCGNVEREFRLAEHWRRFHTAGWGEAGQPGLECRLSAVGGAARIYGLQLEAQSAPSEYKRSSGDGAVYENSRFADGVLRVRAVAPGCYAAEVRIMSPIVE
jgi:hypothetical protein